MKVLDKQKDVLSVQISKQEFLVLLSAMGYVSSEYDALDTLRLGFSEVEADQIADAMYDIFDKEYPGAKRPS